MTRRLILIAVVAGMARMAQAQTGQVFNVVSASRFDGSVQFQILDEDGLKQLRKEVDLDNQARPKAYDNVRKAWRAEQEKKTAGSTAAQQTRTPAFPLRPPPPRVVNLIGKFQSEEAATEKRKAVEDQMAEAEKKKDDEQQVRKSAVDEKAKPSESGLKRPEPKKSANKVDKTSTKASEEKERGALLAKFEAAVIAVRQADELADSGVKVPEAPKPGGKSVGMRKVHRMGESGK